jgi:hypothetical protein
VPIGERRHLRKVRHDQHLVLAGQPGQPPADLDRRLPADPGVDLVEHQRGWAADAGEHDLDGEHHARQLTARGALLQRLRGRTGCGSSRSSTSSAPSGPTPLAAPVTVCSAGPEPTGLGATTTSMRAMRHREAGELGGDLGGEPGGRLAPRRRQHRRQLGDLAGEAAPLAVELFEQLVGRVELAETGRARSAQATTPSTSSAYFRVSVRSAARRS